ncbi:hypothetical protein XELAEV_18010067mg [Xenopus laevis]|uniref:Uncharacterized protein n=1 Tax=Xenopus laevis TaxID=8355 RepID=A0A974I1G3_XENLA|nr:hypothetical protein XELAEV_18010067mg [Xenopus laevis]
MYCMSQYHFMLCLITTYKESAKDNLFAQSFKGTFCCCGSCLKKMDTVIPPAGLSLTSINIILVVLAVFTLPLLSYSGSAHE